MRNLSFLGILSSGLLFLAGCSDSKQMEMATKHAREWGTIRCRCEKLQAAKSPEFRGCIEEMERTLRYMKTNLELGNAGSSDRAKVTKAGDEAYAACKGR